MAHIEVVETLEEAHDIGLEILRKMCEDFGFDEEEEAELYDLALHSALRKYEPEYELKQRIKIEEKDW